MNVMVSLLSKKHGELKRFLEKYYLKELEIDEDLQEWICVYNRPLESIDLISTVIDNCDKYDILVSLQLGDQRVYPVTSENHNDVVKGMFSLFYEPQDS